MTLTQDQRIKLVIAGVVLGLVILVVVLIISLATRIPEAKISSAFAKNITHPTQIDDNTIYFFAGSAFASYDLTNYTTKPLTQFYSLPEIVDVKISKDGALLHASNSTLLDQMHDTIIQLGLDPLVPYWWVFNFKNGNFSLVSKDTIQQIMWIDGDTYIFSQPEGTGDTMKIFRADIGSQPTEITSLSATYELVTANDTSVSYLKQVGIEDRAPSELVQLDLVTKQTTTLARDVQDVLATGQDGSMLFLINTQKDVVRTTEDTPEEESGLLTFYDAAKKTTSKIEDRFTGTVSWQLTTNKWLAIGRNALREPISIRNDNGKITKFKTPTRSGLEFFPIGRTAKGDIIANGYDEVFYASTQALDDLPTTISYNNLPANGFEPSFSYAYDKTQRQYNIYLQTDTNKAGIEAALQHFKDHGVDPYQLYIKWYGVEPDLTH